MARILKFPIAERLMKPPVKKQEPSTPEGSKNKVLEAVSRGLWVSIVLLWPVLRWVVSIDVFIRLVVMLYHWDTPGKYEGWVFLLHATVLVALTYYVSIYRPKGIPT